MKEDGTENFNSTENNSDNHNPIVNDSVKKTTIEDKTLSIKEDKAYDGEIEITHENSNTTDNSNEYEGTTKSTTESPELSDFSNESEEKSDDSTAIISENEFADSYEGSI